VLADDVPAPVEEPRLREAGAAVVGKRRAAPVSHDRVRDAVPLGEPPRVAAEVLRVDTEDDETVGAIALRGRLEQPCFLLARDAPRRPEVEDDRMPAQRAKAQRPLAVQAREREVRRGSGLARGERSVEAATAPAGKDLDAEEREQQPDARERERLQQQMRLPPDQESDLELVARSASVASRRRRPTSAR
jgi:hypothetical protein